MALQSERYWLFIRRLDLRSISSQQNCMQKMATYVLSVPLWLIIKRKVQNQGYLITNWNFRQPSGGATPLDFAPFELRAEELVTFARAHVVHKKLSVFATIYDAVTGQRVASKDCGFHYRISVVQRLNTENENAALRGIRVSSSEDSCTLSQSVTRSEAQPSTMGKDCNACR